MELSAAAEAAPCLDGERRSVRGCVRAPWAAWLLTLGLLVCLAINSVVLVR